MTNALIQPKVIILSSSQIVFGAQNVGLRLLCSDVDNYKLYRK